MRICREGPKPLVEASIEMAQAINGIGGAVGALENQAGLCGEILMELTMASQNR
jgi:hypothetical protein